MGSATFPASWKRSRTESSLSPEAAIEALLASSRSLTTGHQRCLLSWRHWPALKPGAKPLLLLHGGFGSWTHWIANIESLRSGFEVWTVDLPGLGDSGDLPAPQSVDHIADLIYTGWRELVGGDQPFAVAGFSFGAMVAGQLAVLAGEQCENCILVGAVGFGHLQVQVPLKPPPDPDADRAAAEEIHRENLQRLMLHDNDRIDSLAIQIHAKNLARFRLRSRGMAASNQLAETLPRISARLCAVWGVFDATAGGPAQLDARRDIIDAAQPGAGFHLLPGVGHWAMYESPVSINDLILAQGK